MFGLYSKKQLVAFGNYMVSEERVRKYTEHSVAGMDELRERLSRVNDSDLDIPILKRRSLKEKIVSVFGL